MCSRADSAVGDARIDGIARDTTGVRRAPVCLAGATTQIAVGAEEAQRRIDDVAPVARVAAVDDGVALGLRSHGDEGRRVVPFAQKLVLACSRKRRERHQWLFR